jgi:cysteine-rich repeat protein
MSDVITDCGPEGTVVSVQDCERSDGFCVETSGGDFECVSQLCEPGTRRCGGPDENIDDLFVCDDRGAEEVRTSCTGQICVAGACVDSACDSGSSVCIDDFTVGVCTEDGRGYDRTTCADGQYCDPVANSCVEQLCEPGVSRCGSGNTREVCDERGGSFGIPERCEGATTCIAGVCTDQVCPAGLRYCDDDGRAAACSADGTTVTTQNCDFRCEDGFCEESICGDGIVDEDSDEECDDGDALSCNRCDSCSARNVLVVRDSSRTTATGSWIPNESVFTIEFWVLPEEETGAIFGIGSTNGRDGVLVELNSRYVVFTFRTDEGASIGIRSSARLPLGTWSHVAVTRTGRTAGTIHVNGNLVGASNRDLNRVSIDATDGILWIASDSRVNALASRLDELRVSSSVRYSSNFAPAARFAPDGNTIALWHLDEGIGQSLRSESGGITATVTEVGWNASSCFAAGSAAADCGDGGLAPWEDCDDGNAIAGDGCSPTCRTESRCQVGFERPGASEGGCYFVLNQTQDWETARNTCRALGVSADLATVNNAAENSALRAAMSGNFWIGYNDRDDFIGNGPFVWSAGSSSYANWASGEPNDAGPGSFTREDCAEVRGDGAWNDSRCSDGKFAICEFPF